MIFHVRKKRKLQAILGIVLVVIVAGCGETSTPPPIETTANVHTLLATTMKSSFNNLIKESKSSNAKSLLGSISNLQKMIGPNISTAIPEGVDLEFITRMVEDLFASEVAQELFSDANIISRTTDEIIYEVKPSMCSKLSELMPTRDDSASSTCVLFLESHALEIRVKSLSNKAMQLELWHTQRNKMENLRRVMSLGMSPNLLGLSLNLDGAQEFIDTMMTFGRDTASGLASLGVKKLSGEATVQLRFKSDETVSGCKNAEDFCLLANVDRALDIELDIGKGLSLKLDPSFIDNPSFLLSANSEFGLLAAVNLGALDGKYGEDSAFLEAMQFKLSLPQAIDGSGLQFLIENFGAGPRASKLNVFGKQFIVDFVSSSRSIEKLNFAMEGDFATLSTSPLNLKLTMVDEADASCLMSESLQLASDPIGNTRLKFAMPTSSFPRGSHLLKRSVCSESNLFLLRMWSMFGVSSEDCEFTGLLNIEEGLLELTYDYLLNDTAGQPLILKAEKGQCIRM